MCDHNRITIYRMTSTESDGERYESLMLRFNTLIRFRNWIVHLMPIASFEHSTASERPELIFYAKKILISSRNIVLLLQTNLNWKKSLYQLSFCKFSNKSFFAQAFQIEMDDEITHRTTIINATLQNETKIENHLWPEIKWANRSKEEMLRLQIVKLLVSK